jgi:YHS domain-containing protein
VQGKEKKYVTHFSPKTTSSAVAAGLKGEIDIAPIEASSYTCVCVFSCLFSFTLRDFLCMRLRRANFLLMSLGFWLSCTICLAQSESRQQDLQGVKGLQRKVGTLGGANGSATKGPLQSSNRASRAPGNGSSGFTIHHDIDLPLALAGYDSVYLNSQQKWKRGLETVIANYDGQRYLFFNERQRAIFLASPHRYVPALGGQCAVTLVELGLRIPGELKYGVLYQNRIYLFADIAQRKRFQDGPEKYRDADLANAGNCPVALLQERRRVLGVPATLHVHDGFRYWFANMAARKEFLKTPSRYVRKAGPLANSQKVVEEYKVQVEDKSLLSDAAKRPYEKLAMNGFCPVSIQGDGQGIGIWDEGKESLRTIYDGKIYQFASQEKKQQFIAAPETYIPAFGGACVVCQKKQGKEVSGSIFHAVVYPSRGGRLFLFTDQEHKEMFKQNPAVYNQIDLALDGNCIVTQQEEGKQVAGDENYLAWYHNQRYLFASSKHRQKFITSPESYITR